MLHAVSWGAFIKWTLLLTLLYYGAIGALFFRKETLAVLRRKKTLVLLLPAGFGSFYGRAQDGNQGISQANTMIRGYFDTGTQLMYAIGAVLALVGAVRVYRVWNNDHREDAQKAAAAWFGSCIFLVVVATV